MALASSVLPTPVGPTKRKVPMGRPVFLTPAAARRRALETAETASSWSTIRSWMSCSRLSSLSRSSSVLATLTLTP